MTTRPRVMIAFIAAMALLAVGCGQSRPSPAVPEVSSPAISESPIKTTLEKDALLVVHAVQELDRNYLYAGAAQAPEELKLYMTDVLWEAQKQDYALVKRENLSFRNIDKVRIETAPYQGEAPEGTLIAVHACSDYRQVETYKDNEFKQFGPLSYDRYFLKEEDGRLKIFSVKNDPVSSCTL